jgi:hypothetical protein
VKTFWKKWRRLIIGCIVFYVALTLLLLWFSIGSDDIAFNYQFR